MRVPTVRSPSVQAAGLPDVRQAIRTTSAEFGGLAAEGMIGAGKQVQDLGSVIRDHALVMAEHDARVEADEAEPAWATTRRQKLLEGDGAYFGRTGKEAYQGMKSAAQDLNAAMEEHAATLSPRAQEIFRKRRSAELSGDLDRMAMHAAGERVKWQDATSDAVVRNHLNEAALETDPARRDTLLNQALEERIRWAQDRGISPDDAILTARISADRSAGVLAALQTDLTRNPAAARKYFDRMKDQWDAKSLSQATDLMALQRSKDEGAHRVRIAEIQTEAQYALQVMSTGVPFAGLASLQEKADRIDPATGKQLREASETVTYAADLRKLDPQALKGEADRKDAEIRAEQDPERAALLLHKRALVNTVAKTVADGLNQDALGWAEAQGHAQKTDLFGAIKASAQASNPEDGKAIITSAMNDRKAAVNSAQAKYGMKIGFFKPPELSTFIMAYEDAKTSEEKLGFLTFLRFLPGEVRAEGITQMRKAGLPDTALRALDRLEGGMGADRAAARRILNEQLGPQFDQPLSYSNKIRATSNYDQGLGKVYQGAYAVTGNAEYLQRANNDREVLLRSAKLRIAGGQTDFGDNVYKDYFDNVIPVSIDNLAHVVVPRGTDRKVLTRGFWAAREQEVARLTGKERPADNPKTSNAGKMWDLAVRDRIRQGGTFVPSGDGIVLIDPVSGKPLAGDDGKVKRWSLQDLVTIGKNVPPEIPFPLRQGNL